MSWHYLQEQGVEFLEATSLIGAPSALLNLIPFAGESCYHDKPKVTYLDSLSGTTSAPLTVTLGEATLTLLAVDSLAKTSVPLEKELELTAQSQAYGVSLRESLGRFGLDLPLLKTRPICEVGDRSTAYSETFPTWGTMLDGVCLVLATSLPLIEETGFGSLPTPTTIGNELSPSMRKHPCHARLISQLPLWREKYSSPGCGPWIAFREWLMGWPIGWTELKPLATARFQEWQRLHSEF